MPGETKTADPAAGMKRVTIVLTTVLTVVLSLRQFLATLFQPWIYEDDAAQHTWWTYRFADSGLFPNDLSLEYFSQPVFAPFGYQGLYRLFVPWIDAQVFSELVPFALTAIMAVFGVLLGRSATRGSWAGGFVGGVFALCGGMIRRIDGGLPRAFAMPVLMFAIWALLERRMLALGIAFICVALFYPPLVVNCGLLVAIVLGWDLWKSRRLPAGWLQLVVCGVIAAGIIGMAYAKPLRPGLGPKLTAAEARAMPEFWPGGRSHFFNPDTVDFYLTDSRPGLGLSPLMIAIVLLVAITTTILWRRTVRYETWVIAFTSIAAFGIAHLVLFVLHLPSRYTRYTFPVVALLYLSAVIPHLGSLAPFRRLAGWVGRPQVLAILGAVVVIGYSIEGSIKLRHDFARERPQDLLATCRFLETLPKDTLIAAHPGDASQIPLLARRSVLANMETSLAYHVGYYREVKRRLTAELHACYASDWADIDPLWTADHVQIFVVNRSRYSHPTGAVYAEPFNTELRPRVDRGMRDGFVLAHPPADRILFESGDYVVVRLAPKS